MKMEISKNDLISSASTFTDIIVHSLSGEKKLMSKCKKCETFITNGSEFKFEHWKHWCIFKHQFKYNIATKLGERKTITCLVCNKKFVSITTHFMIGHRRHCKALQPIAPKPNVNNQQQNVTVLSSANINPPIFSTNTNKKKLNQTGKENTIEIVSQPVANRLAVLDLKQVQFNVVKVMTLDDNRIVDCAQCQFCQTIMIMQHVLHHRSICKRSEVEEQNSEAVTEKPEVLFSVQTVHNQIDSGPFIATQSCFICNSSSSDSFSNLKNTCSAHTNTSILKFVKHCLGGKPSVREKTTDASSLQYEVVCRECLDSINECDANILAANKQKGKLIAKLAKTETYFQLLENYTNVASMPNVAENNNDKREIMNVIDLCGDDDD